MKLMSGNLLRYLLRGRQRGCAAGERNGGGQDRGDASVHPHFLPCFIHLMNLSVCDTDGLARVVDSCVQHVIIGLDNTQVFADLDLSASATDFAQEDDDGDEDDDGSDDDEESDFDDDFNDVVRMNHKILLLISVV